MEAKEDRKASLSAVWSVEKFIAKEEPVPMKSFLRKGSSILFRAELNFT